MDVLFSTNTVTPVKDLLIQPSTHQERIVRIGKVRLDPPMGCASTVVDSVGTIARDTTDDPDPNVPQQRER